MNNDTSNPLKDIPVVHMKRLKRRLRFLLVVSIVIVVALVGAITWLIGPTSEISRFSGSDEASGIEEPGLSAEIVYESPSFNTVVPGGKTIAELGGWARVSPPGSDKVYAFVDEISDVDIIVSQQELPDNFKDSPAGVLKDFAESYAANRTLPTNDDTTAYIGTSAKGPQSVLLIKNDLLILIKSSSVISDDNWVGYINSLE